METAERKLKAQFERIVARERAQVHRPDLKLAAVLVPIVFRDEDPHIILTKRTMTVAHHKGQIAFPGGMAEPEDADAIATALREANEEIGLDPQRVEVLGLLDDVATITGFAVTPVLGLVDPRATFTTDPVEVDHQFEVSFQDLQNPQNYEHVAGEFENRSFNFHQYTVNGKVIWGATALMINRLLVALDHPR